MEGAATDRKSRSPYPDIRGTNGSLRDSRMPTGQSAQIGVAALRSRSACAVRLTDNLYHRPSCSPLPAVTSSGPTINSRTRHERAMDSIDCVVVGAGVIGLAVAHELARAGREVLILERHDAIGTETSSRNSEVIHAGLHYPAGSLKATTCVRGRDLLYAYCEQPGRAAPSLRQADRRCE